MKDDDYSVIMYKILAYFYGCLKNGKRPKQEDICNECELFYVPYSYWANIMDDMISEGYLKNVNITSSHGSIGVKIQPDAAITRKGVDFLEENSRMAKAKSFLGRAFEVALENMIDRLIPICFL